MVVKCKEKDFTCLIINPKKIKYSHNIIFQKKTYIMSFTNQEYFEVIEKNEIVKEAYENIRQICIDLQKQTNCPEEDLKDFLEFISRQWNNS